MSSPDSHSGSGTSAASLRVRVDDGSIHWESRLLEETFVPSIEQQLLLFRCFPSPQIPPTPLISVSYPQINVYATHSADKFRKLKISRSVSDTLDVASVALALGNINTVHTILHHLFKNSDHILSFSLDCRNGQYPFYEAFAALEESQMKESGGILEKMSYFYLQYVMYHRDYGAVHSLLQNVGKRYKYDRLIYEAAYFLSVSAPRKFMISELRQDECAIVTRLRMTLEGLVEGSRHSLLWHNCNTTTCMSGIKNLFDDSLNLTIQEATRLGEGELMKRDVRLVWRCVEAQFSEGFSKAIATRGIRQHCWSNLLEHARRMQQFSWDNFTENYNYARL